MNPRKQYASSRRFNKKLLNFYVQDRIQQLVGIDFSPTTESSSFNNHILAAGRVLYWETRSKQYSDLTQGGLYCCNITPLTSSLSSIIMASNYGNKTE